MIYQLFESSRCQLNGDVQGGQVGLPHHFRERPPPVCQVACDEKCVIVSIHTFLLSPYICVCNFLGGSSIASLRSMHPAHSISPNRLSRRRARSGRTLPPSLEDSKRSAPRATVPPRRQHPRKSRGTNTPLTVTPVKRHEANKNVKLHAATQKINFHITAVF